MRLTTLFFLVSLAFTVLTVVSAQSGRICPLGGAPPAECKGQAEWDTNACRWICKPPVQCLINPCENAARSGACPTEFCTPDYSIGCNFKCSKPDMCPLGGAPPAECSSEGQYEWDSTACQWKCKNIICPQGGAPPAECSGEGQYEWDSKACRWICKQCVSNEGNSVPFGSTYYDKCNGCTCLGDQGACTKKGCLDTCYDDLGNGYATGSTKNSTLENSCNTCTCRENGQWACTEMACPRPPVFCLRNPCEDAAREGVCPMEFCTADYSVGCNFKCSKPDMCVQGGAPPAECSAPGQHQWDSAACQWKCKGCRSNEGKFIPIGATYKSKCNTCTCVGNNQGRCDKRGCFGVCFDDFGKGYQTAETMKQSCNSCFCASNGQWGCTKMACEVVVLSATFQVTMTKKSNTVLAVAAAMRDVATKAGSDVLEAFVISNDDITKMSGNSFNYKWSVVIGIKGDTETQRKLLLAQYVIEAKNTLNAVKINNINADDATATATIESESNLTTQEAMMALQSCPDGSQISAADQCPIDTLAAPATTSSSSSSTPLVAIIVPIIAGVVLLAVIATAVVILRRRANTIKGINNVQQDTQMAQRV